MATSVSVDLPRFPRLHGICQFRDPRVVASAFFGLMTLQALGYLLLGTGSAGMGVSQFIVIVHNLLALACVWAAFRRGQSTAALFWLLVAATLLILLIPSILLLVTTLFHQALVSDSTWRVLWCLYAAPVLMILFLPDVDRRARLKTEVFLDLLQVAIVVGLSFWTLFYLPLQQMLPTEALQRNLNISNLLTLLVVLAVFGRLLFSRTDATRTLLRRLGIFAAICAIVTCMGNWIDLHHYTAAAAWFDLGWDLPLAAAGLVAITWEPAQEPHSARRPVNFFNLLKTNLVLVAVLSSIDLLVDRWKASNGAMLADAAVATMLVAFTLRLALTQYHQQQEIVQRESAQYELFAANETISGLLAEARSQAGALAQISELGSLLQACGSREEAFRIVPERLRRLFPRTSGALSLISASKNRVESEAEWGPCPPADHLFAPAECWALRRGCAHVHPGGESATRCPNLCADGASVCFPLIANGEAIGVLAIQNNEHIAEEAPHNESSPLWRHMATAVVEHVALALSNLNLRESLRTQAVRDPLTSLYNRRYMQEFLERELQRSRRQHRPLAIMMLDLDHFKRYNDLYGHSTGDDTLRLVADALRHSVRADDVACRYGGEEFVIVLPECPLSYATARAEEICKRVKQASAPGAGEVREPLTVSVGIAAFDEYGADSAPLLLKLADEALYQAKHDGRDRVVVAQSIAATTGPAVMAAARSATAAEI